MWTVWVCPTSIQVLPSLSIGKEWCQFFVDFLILMGIRTYWCPRHYEFSNYRGVAWWYRYSQMVSGQFEYVPLQYKCFHHRVLARIMVRVGRFPEMDPSKNILMPTPLWVQELQRSGYWYTHWQLVCGQFEYVPLQFKCFHHRVLARNDFRTGN